MLFWRKRWDSNPRALACYLISSQARYDHFDTLPYIKFLFLRLFFAFVGGLARYVLLRCPKFSARKRCSQNFDRCHSLASLNLPPATLGSLPPFDTLPYYRSRLPASHNSISQLFCFVNDTFYKIEKTAYFSSKSSKSDKIIFETSIPRRVR